MIEMTAGPTGPAELPADWAPRLAVDLAELVSAATELADLVGTQAIVGDFTAELTRMATDGSSL